MVLDGRYTGPGNRDLDFKGKAISLRSKNGPGRCIIDCQGSEEDPHRGFYFHSGEGETSILDGFTIANGFAGGDIWPEDVGGGICSVSASPTIRNNVIACNAAFDGGGSYYDGSGIIDNNTVLGNSASRFGGGISCNWGSPTITNNSIDGNTASDGGGIFTRGTPTIAHNTISTNTAKAWGGGIISWEDNPPTIINNIISHNWAGEKGAGIMLHETGATIIGNLLTGNGTAGEGGGIRAGWPGVTTANNTLVRNSAGSGGGLYGCQGNILNCIIWGNAAVEAPQLSDCGEPTYCCIQGWSGGEGNVASDPEFLDADGPDGNPTTYEDNDYRLSADSPCIDTGNNEAWTAGPTDLDGNNRIFKGVSSATVDMGAYEYGSFPFKIVEARKAPGEQVYLKWTSRPGDTYDVWSCAGLPSQLWVYTATVPSGGTFTPWTGSMPLLPEAIFRIELK